MCRLTWRQCYCFLLYKLSPLWINYTCSDGKQRVPHRSFKMFEGCCMQVEGRTYATVRGRYCTTTLCQLMHRYISVLFSLDLSCLLNWRQPCFQGFNSSRPSWKEHSRKHLKNRRNFNIETLCIISRGNALNGTTTLNKVVITLIKLLLPTFFFDLLIISNWPLVIAISLNYSLNECIHEVKFSWQI